MARFELNVDGRTQSIDADADMPLLYALRDDLGHLGVQCVGRDHFVHEAECLRLDRAEAFGGDEVAP